MPSLIDGIFWGILLIMVGVWFILRRFLPFHIPVVRLIIAILFIYVGIRLLVRGPGTTTAPVFSESHQRYTPGWDRDYNIIFASGDVDLTGVTLDGASLRTRVNVVFGSGILRVNLKLPVRVDMSAAFGAVDAPDGRSVSFGDSVYTTGTYHDGSPALVIHATAVFGRLLIEK
ncbi:MAG TPA: hypothetical protein VMU36_07800 [Spirochaetia bacterium]|nr:hypothetical protein [Spirochaetia bacterium]